MMSPRRRVWIRHTRITGEGDDMSELLLGCGFTRVKKMGWPGATWNKTAPTFHDLYTLDFNEACKPDLLCNLNSNDLWRCEPRTIKGADCVYETKSDRTELRGDFFNEVHAYEVLEHLGAQGDFVDFFATFYNIYRILVPDGLLFASCPSRFSGWLWGDPGHTRAILPESLSFLDQAAYEECGRTTRTDYRPVWRGDFKCLYSSDADKQTHAFVLQAIKPARTVKTFAEEKGLI